MGRRPEGVSDVTDIPTELLHDIEPVGGFIEVDLDAFAGQVHTCQPCGLRIAELGSLRVVRDGFRPALRKSNAGRVERSEIVERSRLMDVAEQVQARCNLGETSAEISAACLSSAVDLIADPMGWTMGDQHVDTMRSVAPHHREEVTARKVSRQS